MTPLYITICNFNKSLLFSRYLCSNSFRTHEKFLRTCKCTVSPPSQKRERKRSERGPYINQLIVAKNENCYPIEDCLYVKITIIIISLRAISILKDEQTYKL